jgi:hypothetical protein
MSHYYAAIEGGRQPVTRTGHKTTGIEAWVQSHEMGIRVTGHWDESTGQDIFRVHLTGGRNGMDLVTHIATLYSSGQGDDVQIVHHIDNGNLHNLQTAQAQFDFMEEASTNY